MKYQNRYTLFADVLGFRELVSVLGTDSSHLQDLLGIYETIQSRPLKLRLQRTVNIQMTVFSDCTVFSVPKTHPGLVALLTTGLLLSVQLLTKRILVRGGISEGMLYHDGNIVFGESLIKAYDLERQSAVFPRILIEEHIAERFLARSGRSPIKDILREDRDGLWKINLFANWSCFSDYVPPRSLEEHKQVMYAMKMALTLKLLQIGDNTRGLSKLKWIISEFNDAIRQQSMLRMRPIRIEEVYRKYELVKGPSPSRRKHIQ